MSRGRIPVMPSDIRDVPDWLRANARRLSFRILFLADDLAAHLERRQAIEAAARETGVQIVDLPTGLNDDELREFMAAHASGFAHLTETPETGNAVAVGHELGRVVNDMLRHPAAQRRGVDGDALYRPQAPR